MKGTVAGAPVSFGVFELTPEGAETVSPDALCEALQSTGYRGIDLGPAGFLGRGDELRARLERFGLELAGGWVQLPFSDDDAFDTSLDELDDALRLFSDAASAGPSRRPLPTLADAGSTARSAAPGRGAQADPLSQATCERLYRNVERAAGIVRAAGFEPTFHHHAGTYVESPDEIDAFLARCDIDLTFDIGHLVLAGGDPVDGARRWGDRINHLHLKDVDNTRVREILATGGGMAEVWSGGAFVPLGRGDVDVAGVMDHIAGIGFDGWVVVEQDVLNGPDVAIEHFLRERTADQRANRDALRTWI
ncbi:sugar phosphate isomerase/epimerase [Microbacterium sp. KUDC0406]|uniref:sugar phosphate isomerase/epimerase family protein n=1 Tax=Microbacterium sp. KUDC0406 TaxID=2909588 RepID=UPI001F2E9669|nr:sugar phosphate isomerase/epimerase [Microbacterium sp. KUDC0406]UJP09928.1 sugar phosphate isomerase/epimerase [Microbacterium sp. KUDC0406]